MRTIGNRFYNFIWCKESKERGLVNQIPLTLIHFPLLIPFGSKIGLLSDAE